MEFSKDITYKPKADGRIYDNCFPDLEKLVDEGIEFFYSVFIRLAKIPKGISAIVYSYYYCGPMIIVYCKEDGTERCWAKSFELPGYPGHSPGVNVEAINNFNKEVKIRFGMV